MGVYERKLTIGFGTLFLVMVLCSVILFTMGCADASNDGGMQGAVSGAGAREGLEQDVQEQDSSDDTSMAALPKSVTIPDEELHRQVDAIVKNKDTWMELVYTTGDIKDLAEMEDEDSYVSTANLSLTDLDQNGYLEVLITESVGSLHLTNARMYELTADDKLKPCEYKTGEKEDREKYDVRLGDEDTCDVRVYYDQADDRYYYGLTNVLGGYGGPVYNKFYLTYRDGECSTKYGGKACAWSGHGYYSSEKGEDEMIKYSEYDKLRRDSLPSSSSAGVAHIRWKEIDKQKLKSMDDEKLSGLMYKLASSFRVRFPEITEKVQKQVDYLINNRDKWVLPDMTTPKSDPDDEECIDEKVKRGYDQDFLSDENRFCFALTDADDDGALEFAVFGLDIEKEEEVMSVVRVEPDGSGQNPLDPAEYKSLLKKNGVRSAKVYTDYNSSFLKKEIMMLSAEDLEDKLLFSLGASRL